MNSKNINDLDYVKKILYNEELSSSEKLIMLCFLAEIEHDLEKQISLTNEEISNLTGCSQRIITTHIKTLIEKKYLKFIHFNGKKRFLKILKV